MWVGGVVASWLVPSSPDRAVLVRALAGDIVLHVLLGKTLYSLSASHHPGVKMDNLAERSSRKIKLFLVALVFKSRGFFVFNAF